MKKNNARANYLLRTYGITEAQYEELLRKQSGNCGCCGRPAKAFPVRLAVDHDHKTGEVRGVLCSYCNHRVVGRHRTPDLLGRAANYLTGPFTGWFVTEKRPKRRRKKRR